jgi:uncharacterized protein YbjT (DUF2867 family)
MKIVVNTPTGHVGSPLVYNLIRAGVRPTLLMRHPSSLDPALLSRVDVIETDLTNERAIVRATVGTDALYWVDPPPTGDDPLADYARFSEIAASAVRANRIPRTVFQSSVGAEKRVGAGEIDGLALTEQLLDDTGRAVTHLRCGYFFTNLLMMVDEIRSGTISVLLPPDQPMSWVAPRDIAEVAALRLLSTAWTGRHVLAVHGPADLSWRQVAAIITETTGCVVQAEQIDDDRMRGILGGFGLSALQVESMVGMTTGLRDGFVPEQPRDVSTTTPTTLASWCYEVLRPALNAPVAESTTDSELVN